MRYLQEKNTHILRVEAHINEPIEEALRRKFVDERKQTQTIADELDIAYLTARKWLDLCGIYSRRLRILDK